MWGMVVKLCCCVYLRCILGSCCVSGVGRFVLVWFEFQFSSSWVSFMLLNRLIRFSVIELLVYNVVRLCWLCCSSILIFSVQVENVVQLLRMLVVSSRCSCGEVLLCRVKVLISMFISSVLLMLIRKVDYGYGLLIDICVLIRLQVW